jgi:YVTN family beta-propeller protein
MRANERLEFELKVFLTTMATLAVSLLRQPFLPGETGAWAETKRLELTDVRDRALSTLTDACLRAGEARNAVKWAEQSVAAAPFRETGYRRLMEAHAAAGNSAEALRVYERCRRLLAEELGAYPSPETESIYRGLLAAPSGVAEASAVTTLRRPDAARVADPPREPGTRPTRRRRSPGTVGAAAAALATAAAVVWGALATQGGETHPTTVAANAVAVIDADGARVRGHVRVAAGPTSIAYGDGAVWVSSSLANRVSRVDPMTRSVRQTITVGNGPSGIGVGGGAVWVANHDDNTVSWINPQSNTVVGTIPVGAGPTAVAFGFGSVWVTNGDDRTLSRIDAQTGHVTHVIRTNAVGRGLAVGGGSVWVTDEATRTVVGVDPATNAVVSETVVGSGPTGIAYGDGSLWIANALDDTVSRIDARTLAERDVIPVAGGPSAIAFVDGRVWVSEEFGGRIVRIDPKRGVIVGSIVVGNRPEGLATGSRGVWVAVRPSGNGHYGGRLIVLDTSRLDSIDPAVSNLTTTYALLRTVYDGLTNSRPVGGSTGSEVVPDLAAALPQPTDEGTSYTFRLRPGIRYSDGTPVRAMDFRRSLEREFTLNGWDAPALATIVGADRCKPHLPCDLSRGVIVHGTSTLTLRLTAADPTLMFDLAPIAPVPAGTPLEDVGTKPIPSTGPYAIESYAPGRLLTLVRNRYFRVWSPAARPRGFPDEIVYRTVRKPAAAVDAVMAGRADVFTEQVPSGQVSQLAARYPNQVHLVPQQATVWVFMNTRRPPFDDPRVRRALNYALDRTRASRLHGGLLLAQPTCQLVPPTTPGYVRYCPYTVDRDAGGQWKAPDIARARRLIAASGAKGSSVGVWTTSYFRGEGLYLVRLLRRLGFRPRLHDVPELARYFQELFATPGAQAGLAAWFGAPHAHDILSLFTCRSSTQNPSHFCDPRIDADVARLAKQVPSPESTRLAARIDHAIVDRAPIVPLYTPRLPDLTSARVGNYQASPFGYPLFDQMWVR